MGLFSISPFNSGFQDVKLGQSAEIYSTFYKQPKAACAEEERKRTRELVALESRLSNVKVAAVSELQREERGNWASEELHL